MNTTSMEFVIAQDKTGKSPIVLSEFMGISKNMEDALLVNPWNLGVGSYLNRLSEVLKEILSGCRIGDQQRPGDVCGRKGSPSCQTL